MANSNEFWAKLRWKLTLPEYIFRPGQNLTRLRRKRAAATGRQVASLPWGVDIQLQLPGLIPNSIWFKGCYDIVMAETLWRLLDPGETALDAGANFGYFTSLMAARTGKAGRVMAFEPHPTMFAELESNCGLWRDDHMGTIDIRQTALSSHAGSGTLVMPESWSDNPGVAFLANDASVLASPNAVEVELARLDDLVPRDETVGVAKFDIEGHEAEAFDGAGSLLGQHRIRDIIFEDIRSPNSPAKAILKKHGYSLFSLAKYLRGPRLCNIDGRGTSPRDDANFVATIDPDRAVRRMAPHGWTTLRSVKK